ncbi:uncharacterized protein DNG_08968 [Cephalotrichum gorgonifer]|uniref:C2H2-type domain-containing protein n=1 Tax=Cephalotrichum gorgonifer TaxID=2041049 RepID=A0AAE8N612_9PEZI|nr:uncharacterized protein DNG_08968 [Cephalotrichum gorgonifer]
MVFDVGILHIKRYSVQDILKLQGRLHRPVPQIPLEDSSSQHLPSLQEAPPSPPREPSLIDKLQLSSLSNLQLDCDSRDAPPSIIASGSAGSRADVQPEPATQPFTLADVSALVAAGIRDAMDAQRQNTADMIAQALTQQGHPHQDNRGRHRDQEDDPAQHQDNDTSDNGHHSTYSLKAEQDNYRTDVYTFTGRLQDLAAVYRERAVQTVWPLYLQGTALAAYKSFDTDIQTTLAFAQPTDGTTVDEFIQTLKRFNSVLTAQAAAKYRTWDRTERQLQRPDQFSVQQHNNGPAADRRTHYPRNQYSNDCRQSSPYPPRTGSSYPARQPNAGWTSQQNDTPPPPAYRDKQVWFNDDVRTATTPFQGARKLWQVDNKPTPQPSKGLWQPRDIRVHHAYVEDAPDDNDYPQDIGEGAFTDSAMFADSMATADSPNSEGTLQFGEEGPPADVTDPPADAAYFGTAYHATTHSPGSFACRQCPDVFSSNNKLHQHIRASHPRGRAHINMAAPETRRFPPRNPNRGPMMR